jgi:hypothetical protein
MHENLSIASDLLNVNQIERNIERALKMVEAYRQLNEQANALRSNLQDLGITITADKNATGAQAAIATPTQRRLYKDIQNFFRANPTSQVSAADIAKAIGYAHKPSIRAYLSKFIKRGLVMRVRRNVYQAANA